MNWLAILNVAEGVLWITIGAIVTYRSRRLPTPTRRVAYTLAFAFFAFAGTDFIEAETGAWYRPWWLLVYNAACLAVIVGCATRYRNITSDPSDG